MSFLSTRVSFFLLFFFNDTATTEIYTLSLHDALPISPPTTSNPPATSAMTARSASVSSPAGRSEEHTSELQSHSDLVCRLLLEKKKKSQKQLHNQTRTKTPTKRHTSAQESKWTTST